jgi:hypothetical protein
MPSPWPQFVTPGRHATCVSAGRRDLLLGEFCTLFVAITNPINEFLDFVTDSEAGHSLFCAGIRQLCRPNGARKAQWPLRVAAGWGGKSGCRAGCGARAWRPCAPQLACHRIYLWCGSRWLRWRVEAFTEPAGVRAPFPRHLRWSWGSGHLPGLKIVLALIVVAKTPIQSIASNKNQRKVGIGGQLRWNWKPIQAGLASSAGTSGTGRKWPGPAGGRRIIGLAGPGLSGLGGGAV